MSGTGFVVCREIKKICYELYTDMRGEIVVIQLRDRGDGNPVNIKLERIEYGITCDGVKRRYDVIINKLKTV